MKAFKVSGTFQMGRATTPFTKEVAAKDKAGAEELVYSLIGSKHGVKRFRVNIDKVETMKPEDVTDTTVSYKIGKVEE